MLSARLQSVEYACTRPGQQYLASSTCSRTRSSSCVASSSSATRQSASCAAAPDAPSTRRTASSLRPNACSARFELLACPTSPNGAHVLQRTVHNRVNAVYSLLYILYTRYSHADQYPANGRSSFTSADLINFNE